MVFDHTCGAQCSNTLVVHSVRSTSCGSWHFHLPPSHTVGLWEGDVCASLFLPCVLVYHAIAHGMVSSVGFRKEKPVKPSVCVCVCVCVCPCSYMPGLWKGGGIERGWSGVRKDCLVPDCAVPCTRLPSCFWLPSSALPQFCLPTVQCSSHFGLVSVGLYSCSSGLGHAGQQEVTLGRNCLNVMEHHAQSKH
jgi:hypothetical protein